MPHRDLIMSSRARLYTRILLYHFSGPRRIKIKLVPSVDFLPQCRRFMLVDFQLIFAFQIDYTIPDESVIIMREAGERIYRRDQHTSVCR